MKKFLSTIAVAGVAALALASCGGNDDNAEKYEGKLTVWCSTSAGVSTMFKEKGDAWLKANGYDKVTLEVAPVGEGDAVGKVMEDLDAAADVYCFAQDQLARAVTGNAIDEVAPLFSEDVKKRNSEGGLISGTVGSKLYAYPLTNDNGYILMYDKKVMEGVDMTDMSAIIAKCNASKTKFSFNLGNVWYSAGFFFSQDEKGQRLCTSSWTTNDKGKFTGRVDTFDSDNGLIALKGMYELATAECFMDSSNEADFTAATPSSVVVVGSWGASTAREALGENFAATVLPKFTVAGKSYQLGSFSGSKLMGVKPQKDSKKARLAHSIANYLSGEEIQKELFKTQGWGGTNLKLQATDEYKNDPVISSLSAQANYAIPQGQIFDGWWTVGNAIKKNLVESDGTDDGLRAVLKKYTTDLDAAFSLQGVGLWVGENQGWNNTDKNSLLVEESTGVYSITVTYAGLDYKGGRIVKPSTWDTLAGWDHVDEESLKFLNAAEAENGDRNLVFAEDGTYKITYDQATEKITITKVEA